MFDFSTKYTFESSVLPGVKITIRRLSEMQRARRDLKIAAHQIRLLEIEEMIRRAIQPYLSTETFECPIAADIVHDSGDHKLLRLTRQQAVALRSVLPSTAEVPEMPDSVALEIARLNQEKTLIMAEHIRPANIRSALLSIDGPLSYDGRPANADLLLENGPDELTEEISAAVDAHAGLTIEQRKNSSSPSDSGDPAAETSPSTTATTA